MWRMRSPQCLRAAAPELMVEHWPLRLLVLWRWVRSAAVKWQGRPLTESSFSYSVQKDAYADLEFMNDVGHLDERDGSVRNSWHVRFCSQLRLLARWHTNEQGLATPSTILRPLDQTLTLQDLHCQGLSLLTPSDTFQMALHWTQQAMLWTTLRPWAKTLMLLALLCRNRSTLRQLDTLWMALPWPQLATSRFRLPLQQQLLPCLLLPLPPRHLLLLQPLWQPPSQAPPKTLCTASASAILCRGMLMRIWSSWMMWVFRQNWIHR